MDDKKLKDVWNTVMTSTPTLSDSHIADLYKRSQDQDWFEKEYLGTFDVRSNNAFLDPSVLTKGTISASSDVKSTVTAKELMDSMEKAKASIGPSLAKPSLTAEDLRKFIDSTASKPAKPELHGTALIAEALRTKNAAKQEAAQKELRAMNGEPAPRQEPKPPQEIERGPEWGSW
jgi:hypothetical protein